jgi:hypothetical protein
MANWTMQDRVTHNEETRTIGEWLDATQNANR